MAIAEVIDQALREKRHALVEGPCGTGKGLAYGVPAVWHAHHAKKRVVIVTANIALQEQLVEKDLPALARILPWSFSFALLKGRNNFLCAERLERIHEEGYGGLLSERGEEHARRILEWAPTTRTGDVSELPFVPEPDVWSRLSVRSDDCLGDGCPHEDECFANEAKAKAHRADIVVTNYSMLFAHLSVRKNSGLDLVLPRFDALILDEAHEAADTARDFFGSVVSKHTLARLARRAESFGYADLARSLRTHGRAFFEGLAAFAHSPTYGRRLKAPGFVAEDDVTSLLDELSERALRRASASPEASKERTLASQTARQAEAAAGRLREGVQQADANKVYWLADEHGGTSLRSKPIDVSALLRAQLFDACPSVSLVSATLTTEGTFDFVRRQTGVPEGALEVVAESPFHFVSQALLVLPETMPDPRDEGFVDAAADAFRKVIRQCGGRTLGLFTSYKNLNAVHAQVADDQHTYLRQGDLPRRELTRLFQEDVSSVLFGTDSFWTGIDVPGEALTAVVIDKLPFVSPDDPVIDALCEHDKQAFRRTLLPMAIIAFRQGVGRLIRSQRDVGVVVVLDRRLLDKPYGRAFLKSLPTMPRARSLAHVPPFLRHASAVMRARSAA